MSTPFYTGGQCPINYQAEAREPGGNWQSAGFFTGPIGWISVGEWVGDINSFIYRWRVLRPNGDWAASLGYESNIDFWTNPIPTWIPELRIFSQQPDNCGNVPADPNGHPGNYAPQSCSVPINL